MKLKRIAPFSRNKIWQFMFAGGDPMKMDGVFYVAQDPNSLKVGLYVAMPFGEIEAPDIECEYRLCVYCKDGPVDMRTVKFGVGVLAQIESDNFTA